jgi:ferredoxin
MNNWNSVLTYAAKAEGIPEFAANPQVCICQARRRITVHESCVGCGGCVGQCSPAATLHPTPQKATRMKVLTALAHLQARRYSQVAAILTACAVEPLSDWNTVCVGMAGWCTRSMGPRGVDLPCRLCLLHRACRYGMVWLTAPMIALAWRPDGVPRRHWDVRQPVCPRDPQPRRPASHGPRQSRVCAVAASPRGSASAANDVSGFMAPSPRLLQVQALPGERAFGPRAGP